MHFITSETRDCSVSLILCPDYANQIFLWAVSAIIFGQVSLSESRTDVYMNSHVNIQYLKILRSNLMLMADVAGMLVTGGPKNT